MFQLTDPKGLIQRILDQADIQIDGDRPWDLQVHNDDFYGRIMRQGTLGLGESYMDGWWDCQELDVFFHRILRADAASDVRNNWRARLLGMMRRIMNLQRKSKAYEIGEKHYDKGNDLYRAMLDEHMVYSCAYWKDADTLDEAQEAKLDLICRKINLEPGMRVLDIGCGWGSFARYAAVNYGAEVVGITVSQEQVDLGSERCEGLPVEIRLQDYRDLEEHFDRIVSVGMFEHVGPKNYDTYMRIARRCLADDGLFLLHTIGSNTSGGLPDVWVQKYIFPGGYLPAIQQISEAAEGRFVVEDWHNFGAYYDPTLMAWYDNFEDHWDDLKANYDERFYRMWRYYLLLFAGVFRSRYHQVWQIVFSPKGLSGGYESVR